MQRLTALRSELETWQGLDRRLNDLHEMALLLEVEPEEELSSEVDRSAEDVERQLFKLRF